MKMLIIVKLIPEILEFRISTLKNVTDAGLITYFQRVVQHIVIKLVKTVRLQNKNICISDLSEGALSQLEIQNSSVDIYNNLLLCDIKKLLATKEYQVIYLFFFRRYSISEIAKILGISRQAANKHKLNGLKKLKMSWE